MTAPPARDRATRIRDARAALEHSVDVWVASSAAAGPYLVPLSLAWLDERVVVAVASDSRTARNLLANGTARLAVGPTRDVLMIDAVLESSEPVQAGTGLADRYAARSDWDPRTAGDGYLFVVLRPERIQAWRESNELAGRTLMRQGEWLE